MSDSGAAISALSGEFIKVSSSAPHVALVELSRYWTEFGHVFDKISRDPTVRAVVLASSLPKAFSAGLDLKALGSLEAFAKEPDRHALQLRDHISSFQCCISAVERCSYPVIAAVHGIALGLSIDIICACDIRYAASDAMFSIKEVDIGLAADIGTLARLPKIAGNMSMVHELAYTARNFSAVDAEKMGLVSQVVQGSREEVVRSAVKLATAIAGKSPIAVLGTKHLLLHARDHTVQQNLDYTATWNSIMVQTADMKEALRAVKAKEKPHYPPLAKLPSKL
ncbi:ClpP/crotonase [Laetiporus sulphureus 93-53]|uniref:ClpP/crotonase n=1 Tax=Laetiporus sulphureus 93-53 TaxID=1314785 RepID=A0A165FEC4_9APHY|nr:ClpP/crotonase [Laetiporus sulphureus 93-53]KZT08840.1 ClpP/crotonase [Laetiporus sulphureus 93-53]